MCHQNDDFNFFFTAQSVDFNGLLEEGFFTLVHKPEASGHHIYGSLDCAHIKMAETFSAYTKCSMFFQAFRDKLQGLLTYSQTVRRFSKRVLLDIQNIVGGSTLSLAMSRRPPYRRRPQLNLLYSSSLLSCSIFRLILFYPSNVPLTACLKQNYTGLRRITTTDAVTCTLAPLFKTVSTFNIKFLSEK